MKKHDVNYHDHDNSISFHFDHCNHLEASKRSFSNQSTKKKDFFSNRIFFNQSELIKIKELKIFLEKINNSSKTILKRATLMEFSKRLNERSERSIERRMNES
jgi:LmbE family N-acetylglucosaminyl deacetylase